jgi:hypothetical protein
MLPRSTFVLMLSLISTCAFAQSSEPMTENALISRHQRCVMAAFTKNLQGLKEYDPQLLDKSVIECDGLLATLRSVVLSRTHDAKFADAVIDKVRVASKRGAAAAILAVMAKSK